MITNKLRDDFKALLSKESLKLTAARLAVLEDLLSSDAHRECEEIFNDLLKKKVKNFKSHYIQNIGCSC